jgi:hypothetical protein
MASGMDPQPFKVDKIDQEKKVSFFVGFFKHPTRLGLNPWL